LLGEGFDVIGVVTRADKPRGRSRSVLVPSAVKELAVAEEIPVLQPESPRGEDFAETLRALAPDISVVVAYGHILPESIIALPRRGTVNIHASLLPALRGAAPIQRAIQGGLTETGVSIMRIVKALDAGPVIHQLRTPILPDETYGELQGRLAELGATALIEALALIDAGAATETAQDESRATYAAKVSRDDARVQWTASSVEVGRVIRAFDPAPGAFTSFHDADLKLFGAHPADNASNKTPGTVLAIDPHGVSVATGGQGAVRIPVVQPAGRQRMRADEWARGRAVAPGARFGN
jgi:methionyl-tRNA formyltransferase